MGQRKDRITRSRKSHSRSSEVGLGNMARISHGHMAAFVEGAFGTVTDEGQGNNVC